MGEGVWNVREEHCFQRKLKAVNSEKEMGVNPARIPPQTTPAGVNPHSESRNGIGQGEDKTMCHDGIHYLILF